MASLFIGTMAVCVAGVIAQNGPYVPDFGAIPLVDGKIPEPLGEATAYAPSSAQKYSSYGGGSESSVYSGGSSYGGESGYGGNSGCYGRPPGMYGDASYDCKTFQVCQADGRLDTLYCPPYTRFNNYLGVCDWHFKVDAYCNPLYKEEYKSNYDSGTSNYGGQSYDKGQNYNNYAQPVITYEKPTYSAGNSNSYAAASGTNYDGSTGGAGLRSPIYNLQAYSASQQSRY